eukprot:scaffold306_cov525-Prasinococcus_capsulatus_cf.AAC.1
MKDAHVVRPLATLRHDALVLQGALRGRSSVLCSRRRCSSGPRSRWGCRCVVSARDAAGQFIEPQQDTPFCQRRDARFLVFFAPVHLQTDLPTMRSLGTFAVAVSPSSSSSSLFGVAAEARVCVRWRQSTSCSSRWCTTRRTSARRACAAGPSWKRARWPTRGRRPASSRCPCSRSPSTCAPGSSSASPTLPLTSPCSSPRSPDRPGASKHAG